LAALAGTVRADQVPGHDSDKAWMDAYAKNTVAWMEGVVTAVDAANRQFTVQGKSLEKTTGLAARFGQPLSNSAYKSMTIAQLKSLSSDTLTVGKSTNFFGTKFGTAEGSAAQLASLRVGDIVRVGYDDGWFTDTAVSVQVFGHNDVLGKDTPERDK